MKADRLLPKAWLWRVTLVRIDQRPYGDLRYEVRDRRTLVLLAVVVPEHDEELAFWSDGEERWIVADGNMVTRWYGLDDALLYAAQPRGDWSRSWPLSKLQFWGDRLRLGLRMAPEPDYPNGDIGEIEGWPDDPRWSALFDETVWLPGEVSA